MFGKARFTLTQSGVESAFVSFITAHWRWCESAIWSWF